jgi:hypothetical protein
VETACPGCGAGAEFEARTVQVLRGSCPGCGKAFTIVEDDRLTPGGVGGDSGAEGPSGPTSETNAAPSPGASSGPPCGSCGAALTLRSASSEGIQAACGSCGAAFTYVLASPSAPGPRRSFAPRRGPPRDEGSGFGPPRSRPCRECGGPLRFSTDAEGNVTGECSSCGNRFTLPPRPRYGGGSDRPERRGPGRGFSPSYRGGGRWPGRGGGGSRPYRSSGSRPDRRERAADDDEDGDRRRRRPRRT